MVLQPVEIPHEATGKIRHLSDKLKRRAFENAMSRAGAIQKRSEEAVAKLRYTVDLVSTIIHSFLNTYYSFHNVVLNIYSFSVQYLDCYSLAAVVSLMPLCV